MTSVDSEPEQRTEVSEILAAGRRGEQNAHRSLVPLLYDELRSVARRHLRNRQPGLRLDTTELVHETFIKLAEQAGVVNDREHFFSLAAQAMRHILIDLGRRAIAAKRGYGQPHEVLEEDRLLAEDGEAERWLAVDQALEQLKDVHPRLVRVVECRFFGGLTEEETAEAIGVTSRTVQRDWKRARLWLRTLLAASDDRGDAEDVR